MGRGTEHGAFGSLLSRPDSAAVQGGAVGRTSSSRTGELQQQSDRHVRSSHFFTEAAATSARAVRCGLSMLG